MSETVNEIHIFCEDFDEFFVRYAEQVGRREVFIEAEKLLPVDTPVEVVFFVVYKDLVFFRASGNVFNIVEPDQSGSGTKRPGGMGIKIEEMNEEVRNYFVSLVKSQLKSELSRMFTT